MLLILNLNILLLSKHLANSLFYSFTMQTTHLKWASHHAIIRWQSHDLLSLNREAIRCGVTGSGHGYLPLNLRCRQISFPRYLHSAISTLSLSFSFFLPQSPRQCFCRDDRKSWRNSTIVKTLAPQNSPKTPPMSPNKLADVYVTTWRHTIWNIEI